MQLQYGLTRWDLLVGGMRGLFFLRSIVLLVVVLIVSVWCLIFFSVQRFEAANTIVSIVFATLHTIGASAAGMFCAFLVIATSAYFRNDKGVLGEHTLEITDEGLVESTEVNTTLHKWNSMFRIRRTGSYILIFVAEGVGHIVPLKQLPNDGSVEEFIVELESRIRHSQR
jgi:hypothetical protein